MGRICSLLQKLNVFSNVICYVIENDTFQWFVDKKVKVFLIIDLYLVINVWLPLVVQDI